MFVCQQERLGADVRAISLFSGVGGLDMGFERAGIETVLQAEQDPWCLEVLARHWPQTERVTDVRDVQAVPSDSDEFLQQLRSRHGSIHVDLVYGGFPCQDVSVAGKRAGLGGERSGLWFEFERIVSELRPRWVVVENVPGLLSSNQGRDFAVILDGLGELGFDVAWAVLDAQHFGVPQRRRRVFIVASAGGGSPEQVLSLCEGCGGNPAAGRAPRARIAATLRGRSHGAGVNPLGRGGEEAYGDNLIARTLRAQGNDSHREDTSTYVTAHTLKRRPDGVHGDGSDNLVPMAIRTAQTGSNGWGVGTDEQAYTLDGAQGQAVIAPELAYALAARNAKGVSLLESQDTFVTPGAGVRRLTPLECERLMGWPDDWTRWTAGGKEIADSHRYRMAGNGVVASVAEWLGHRIVAVDLGLT